MRNAPPPWLGDLWHTFLTSYSCGKAQQIQAYVTPEEGIPGYIRKQAEQTLGNKPVSNMSTQPLCALALFEFLP